MASAQVSRQRWEVCKGGSVSALPVLPPVRPRGWVQISTSFAVRRALTCPRAQSKLDKLSRGLEKAQDLTSGRRARRP